MKVLLFGAGGQLGRALHGCAPAGIELVALGRSECDLDTIGAAARAIADARPDLVLNASAYTAVDRAESEPERARRINVEAVAEIAAASADAGARLVHVSTDFVFDGKSGTARKPDDPTNPLGVYGLTKLQGEEAAASAAPDVLIVRTAWVYAAEGANFVATMLRLMRERGTVRVVADQIGTPTYAASLATAVWRLAESRAQGLHHYTDAGVASWYDFAVAIAEEGALAGLLAPDVSVVPITNSDYPTPAARPAFSVLDSRDTWRSIGGPPPHWRVNLRACLKEISRGA